MQLQENLTKVLGKHTVKGGYEVGNVTPNVLAEALPSGKYLMSGTELPFAPSTSTGNDFADLLVDGNGCKIHTTEPPQRARPAGIATVRSKVSEVTPSSRKTDLRTFSEGVFGSTSTKQNVVLLAEWNTAVSPPVIKLQTSPMEVGKDLNDKAAIRAFPVIRRNVDVQTKFVRRGQTVQVCWPLSIRTTPSGFGSKLYQRWVQKPIAVCISLDPTCGVVELRNRTDLGPVERVNRPFSQESEAINFHVGAPQSRASGRCRRGSRA